MKQAFEITDKKIIQNFFDRAEYGTLALCADDVPYSFSVVESYSLLPSYFSNTEGLACPATQFFKSIIIDGEAVVVESREEKAKMFEALMQKLQPESQYRSFDEEAYDKVLKATAVIKIVPTETRAKFKFGQHLNEERFDMIIKHLKERGEVLDLETVSLMEQYYAVR